MVARDGVCVYRGGVGDGVSDLGISVGRALWSLYSVRNVVVVVGGGWGASFGMRISQWYNGELVGV